MNLISKDVEQHFAVAVSLQVAVEEAAAAVQHVSQIIGIGEVAWSNKDSRASRTSFSTSRESSPVM